MASITRKRRGVYAVRWRDPDGRGRQRTVNSRQAAEDLARDVEYRVDRGDRWEPRGARTPPHLSAVFEAYWRSQIRLRPRTRRSYARALDAFIRWAESQGRHTDARALSRRNLRDFHAYLTSTGSLSKPDSNGRRTERPPRSPATAKKYAEVVSLAWRWAWDEDDEHAWAGMIPRFRVERLPGGDPPLTVAPTWAQMDAALQACQTRWHYQLAFLLRCTGMRTSAALLLRWEDVDLERAVLRIPSEITKGGYGGRTVPLAPQLVRELSGWGVREGFLIQAPEAERVAARAGKGPSGKPGRGRAARNLAAAWKRSGAPEAVWKGQPCKAFRKGLTTELKRAGADLEAVERLVGHRRNSVRSHYLDDRALEDLMREALALIPDPVSTVPVATLTSTESRPRVRAACARRTAPNARSATGAASQAEWRRVMRTEPE